MSEINLLPNETIIMHDSEMKHDRGGMFDSELDELVLTNLALIVVHRNIWGKFKDTQRYPLDQVKVVNGSPQVYAGTSSSGENQLQVHFLHGMEAFALGESDADSEAGFLESFFTPLSDKERRNIHDWRAAVSQAVLGIAQCASPQPPAPQPAAPPPQPAPVKPTPTPPVSSKTVNPVEVLVGAVTAGAAQLGTNISKAATKTATKTTTPPQPPANQTTRKCIGCTAPLSGTQGQKVTCKYCDTEQVI